ncbi:MAG: glutamate-1-semialdehyde 2,1-aminomutase [Clostridiales bacterium]
MNDQISQDLFQRAQKVLPGGVNSPVRAFGAVGGTPRFIQRAEAARIWDVDGNEYIDCIGSWGPMLLGHNHPVIREAVIQAAAKGLSFGAATAAEVEMAELICSMVKPVEMVRMVNSGTEAVMSALRAARGYTGREKIIKFSGCYHGHSDSMLVKAGSGALSFGNPDSGGVTQGAAQDTLLAEYNDLASVKDLFNANPQEIAAVIIEPVAANMGVVPPQASFLADLRQLCHREGALLIFDEVITGFRLAADGAQGFFGVEADLVTYGKIIGAGMPVGAYGGRRDIMSKVAPLGKVYQAGTLSGNPVAMAAGLACLRQLADNPSIYTNINKMGAELAAGLRQAAGAAGNKYTVNQVGSLVCLFFTEAAVTDFAGAKTSDTGLYAKFFHHMLDNGVYLAPAQFEAMFVSQAHSPQDMEHIINTAAAFFNSGGEN